MSYITLKGTQSLLMGQDGGDVVFHGALGQEQARGDLAVGPALLAALSPLADSPPKDAVHCLVGATIAWLVVTPWRTTAGPDT
jgi:hypothetical protein